MKPSELVDALVRRSGKSLRQVATEMANERFQGTLHKFVNGNVPSPSRATAERIASYFDLPVDAIYDEAVATRIATDQKLLKGAPARLVTLEQPATYPVAKERSEGPEGRFSKSISRRISALDADQIGKLEAVVVAFLDAINSEVRKAKPRRR